MTIHHEFEYIGQSIEDRFVFTDENEHTKIARYAAERLPRTFLAAESCEKPPRAPNEIRCAAFIGQKIEKVPAWLLSCTNLMYLGVQSHLLDELCTLGFPQSVQTLEVFGTAPAGIPPSFRHEGVLRLISWSAPLCVKLGAFPCLAHLHVASDRSRALLRELGTQYRSLISFSAMPLSAIATLSPIDSSRLRYLRIVGGQVESLDGLERFSSITNLHLQDMRKLVSIAAIGRISTLRELSIGYCPKVSDFLSITGVAGLRKLSVYGCGKAAVPLRSGINANALVEAFIT